MDIREVFEQKIKIDSKVVSLETLFNNESRLKNTNYKPSYQRNYVWDDEKATYFIESILLGTEIPPLIYFRNISKVEIIDGRQRYETILRFTNNDFKLKSKGLKKLNSTDFINKSCSDLAIHYQDLIYETKIRIIEFSFNTKVGITEEVEDIVKKEIFKRYNSGITPLKTTEVEKAEFYYNDVNQMFRDDILKDKVIERDLKKLFHFEKSSTEILLKKIRELLVISYIPIKYFSIEKSNIINLYYEHMFGEDSSSDIDFNDLKNDFIQKINIIRLIYDKFSEKDKYNRLISECLYWILSILKTEGVSIDEVKKISHTIVLDIEKNIDAYSMDRSSFYNKINTRYDKTMTIFKEYYNILKKDKYLTKTQSFTAKLENINIENQNTKESHFKFEELRLNRIEPSSISIDDITRAMERQKFLIRPQYQRKEVIDKKKASSIIESILLGIKLPPLFVYKNADGVSEVIDGQQRLLSILGFMGKKYYSEFDDDNESKIRNFRLDLKNSILKHLHGSTFSEISIEYQELIRNFDLWIIDIDHRYNPNFDAVDLFLRLNYKPYPIKLDSFEMWNSYISRDLIDTIKFITNNYNDWFYLRKSSTRMENESLFSTLLYLYVEQIKDNNNNNNTYTNSKLDIYKVSNKVLFRLKSKSDVTRKFEEEAALYAKYSIEFEINFMRKLETLISYTYDQKSKATALDFILNVEKGRRTQQSLYALFYFLQPISLSMFEKKGKQIVNDLKELFRYMSDIESIEVFHQKTKEFIEDNTDYEEINSTNFHQLILKYLCRIEKYKEYSFSYKKISIKTEKIKNDLTHKIVIKNDITAILNSKTLNAKLVLIDFKAEEGTIELFMDRPLVSIRYICGLLNSTSFFKNNLSTISSFSLGLLSNKSIPIIDKKYQQIYDVIFFFAYELESPNNDYYKRIIEIMYDIIINKNNIPKAQIIELYNKFIDLFNKTKIYSVTDLSSNHELLLSDELKEKNSFLSKFMMNYIVYKI